MSGRMRGFTLFEVLIALVIISIGVLGVAAVQAVSLANTHGSSTESIIAVETRGLAEAMLANPGYWDSSSVPSTVTITAPTTTGGTPSIASSGSYNSGANCVATVCSNADLASYDLKNWAAQFFSVVPNATKAAISCAANSPPMCTITITWTQKNQVAINTGTQAASGSSGTTTQTYSMVNEM